MLALLILVALAAIGVGIYFVVKSDGEGKCKEDVDCGIGEECDDGECVPLPKPDSTKCTKDSDCPAGEECGSTQKCVPKDTPLPDDKCKTNGDCPAGEKCVKGECVKPTPPPPPPPPPPGPLPSGPVTLHIESPISSSGTTVALTSSNWLSPCHGGLEFGLYQLYDAYTRPAQLLLIRPMEGTSVGYFSLQLANDPTKYLNGQGVPSATPTWFMYDAAKQQLAWIDDSQPKWPGYIVGGRMCGGKPNYQFANAKLDSGKMDTTKITFKEVTQSSGQDRRLTSISHLLL